MLNQFVEIRKSLSDSVYIDGVIRGAITIDDESKAAMLALSREGCIEEPVFCNGRAVQLVNLNQDEVCEVSLLPGNVSGGRYYESFDRFVKANQIAPPSDPYYIHDLDYFHGNATTLPEDLEKYFAVVSFVDYLRSVADYSQNSDLVFITKSALEISVNFNTSDLSCDLKELEVLVSHLSDESQRLERKQLFKSVLSQFIGDELPKFERFRYLLRQISNLNEEYRNSHQLYVEQYSFHKVKAELDKELLDLGDKIQGVINDAQNKFIAVPAAFVLLATNFDFSGKNLALNGTLVIGSLFFSVLVQILLGNQFASLAFIEDATNRFEGSVYEEKKGILKTSLKSAFDKIKKRRNAQKTKLWLIAFLVWVAFLVSVGLYIYSLSVRLSEPIHVPPPT